jgi:hypothetical protein
MLAGFSCLSSPFCLSGLCCISGRSCSSVLSCLSALSSVMLGLDPSIHATATACRGAWILGSRPRMTTERVAGFLAGLTNL